MRCVAPIIHAAQRGVVTVEFALLLALVLVPLTFGATELGRAAYQYNTLTKAVRDAARYASTQTPGTNAIGIKCIAITGNPANDGTNCLSPVLVPGLTLAKVTICDRTTAACDLQPVVVGGVTRGTVHLFVVTISGQVFTSLVSAIVPGFTFGPIRATFTVKA